MSIDFHTITTSCSWVADHTDGALLTAIAAAFIGYKAYQAAARLTAIERTRLHTDLAPVFAPYVLTEGLNGIEDNGSLLLTLTGPVGLDRLDEAVVRILNEAATDYPMPPGLTPEQQVEWKTFVFGPWEFNTGDSEHVQNRQTSKPLSLSRVDGGNSVRLSLRRTRPATWMTDLDTDRWRDQRSGPLRLSLTCRRAPYAPWFLMQ